MYQFICHWMNIANICRMTVCQFIIVYQPPVISGPGPENNRPPPLTLGKEVELCWLLPLPLKPSADMHLSLLSSPLTETFSIKLLKILNIFVPNDTQLNKSDTFSKKI